MPVFPAELCLCIGTLVLLFSLLTILIYYDGRKFRAGILPEADINQALHQIAFLMHYKKWKAQVFHSRGKIRIDKNSNVSVDVYLKRAPRGGIEVLYSTNIGTMAWAIIVVASICTVFIGGVIMAIYIHGRSRDFARKKVIPMIMAYPLGRLPPDYQKRVKFVGSLPIPIPK